ncbi:methyltransferase domain-containing protein [Candidatus Uhrbacteria bacterium]|nr:methyltransferase domain-containing protein [Candidatus Uhrbacteria bacterium]
MNNPSYIGGTELLNPVQLLTRVGLRAGMHVADLGCGVTGHFIIPAARMVGKDGKAYAVDVQQSVLHAVASRAKSEGIAHLETVWSDIERVGATRIPVGTLDAVLIVTTLLLTSKRASVLQEAARLLKSGGLVLVIEWKPDATTVGPAAAQRITADTIRTAAQSAGLTERETFDAGPFHYGVLFVKS